MQRVFAEPTPWHTPWMARVLPRVEAIAGRHTERSVFTRFIPPARPEDMRGTWQRYYHRWRGMTREELAPGLLELVPPLARLAPPATVINKHVYSPFVEEACSAICGHGTRTPS
jgi:nicotinamidase-related amidase